MPFPDNIINF